MLDVNLLDYTTNYTTQNVITKNVINFFNIIIKKKKTYIVNGHQKLKFRLESFLHIIC